MAWIRVTRRASRPTKGGNGGRGGVHAPACTVNRELRARRTVTPPNSSPPQQAKTRHPRLEKERRGHGLLVADAARTLAEVLGLPKLVALPGPPAVTVAGTLVSSEASMVACWRGCVVGCCGAET